MVNCLAGCGSQYSCDTPTNAIDHASLAPYAKITFSDEGGNAVITVGNQPSPQWGNTASIKTLQVGSSDGLGVKIEIIDELGGAFHKFVEKLNKCLGQSKQNYGMGVQWGWVWADCNGLSGTIDSKIVYVVPVHLEVIFTGGYVKFKIEGTDSMQAVFAARHEEIHGADDNSQYLRTAILDLAGNNEPKFTVNFIKFEKDGSTSPLKFKMGGINGPKGVWKSDGQNKLSTIRNWIKNYVTENDKGIVAFWYPFTSQQPTLELVEDIGPGCGEARNCSQSLATYIVNGGNCSPVLSFSPQINYLAAYSGLTEGAVKGGASSANSPKQTKDCPIQTPQTGIQQSSVVDDNAKRNFGNKQGAQEVKNAAAANVKANMIGAIGAISAELRIQGDPREEFIHPKLMASHTVSLIVINPFSILGGSSSGCGDWLAQPGCNEILSNKSWQIMGADHSIKEGSYVTTLQLKLMAPGIDVDANEPFGGPASGGYVPINTC